MGVVRRDQGVPLYGERWPPGSSRRWGSLWVWARVLQDFLVTFMRHPAAVWGRCPIPGADSGRVTGRMRGAPARGARCTGRGRGGEAGMCGAYFGRRAGGGWGGGERTRVAGGARLKHRLHVRRAGKTAEGTHSTTFALVQSLPSLQPIQKTPGSPVRRASRGPPASPAAPPLHPLPPGATRALSINGTGDFARSDRAAAPVICPMAKGVTVVFVLLTCVLF